ncbi:thiamine transporter 2-like [Entelurus aequoreus]|uniref:thiamine transporter 2-like n=1 Tax=Entelurus aequoreus TaxID=161455 RepID=UPI002B1DD32D|nr:thiamine transporter 2-like [Entelurus aequoreus]
MTISYAVVTASDVAYFSYIYSIIPMENYQRATGYLRSAVLFGYTFGAGLGQILISLAGLDYFHINAITLGVVSVAFLLSFWLPKPKRSMFFKGRKAVALGQKSQQTRPVGAADETVSDAGSGKRKMEHNDSTGCYICRHLIYWSLWWALATAGYTQIMNYIQLMWDHIEPSATSSVYNGGVEAACSLVGAAAALSVSHIKVNWTVWGELALGVFSAIGAGAVFLTALTSNIWACYAGYALFKSCYMLLITVTTFQIAANLSLECYALTFGINTFVALVLQTVMTLIFVDEATLGVDIETQFIIYGSYHAAISALFMIRGVYTVCATPSSPGPSDMEKERDDTAEVIYAESF